jgi:hypothetical protein
VFVLDVSLEVVPSLCDGIARLFRAVEAQEGQCIVHHVLGFEADAEFGICKGRRFGREVGKGNGRIIGEDDSGLDRLRTEVVNRAALVLWRKTHLAECTLVLLVESPQADRTHVASPVGTRAQRPVSHRLGADKTQCLVILSRDGGTLSLV